MPPLGLRSTLNTLKCSSKEWNRIFKGKVYKKKERLKRRLGFPTDISHLDYQSTPDTNQSRNPTNRK